MNAWLPKIDAAARGTLSAMLDGIDRYRAHPYQRDVEDPPAFWAEGTTRVLDYRVLDDRLLDDNVVGKKPAPGMPVVLVPSLINRAYIMDLKKNASFARYLAAAGHAVFCVDWNAPGEVEKHFDLGDYIARLRRAIRACADETGTPVALVGYCMGGVLSLAAAGGLPDQIGGLVLMATPWDFHVKRRDQAKGLAHLAQILAPSLSLTGEMPADLLQTLFLGLDPMLGIRKFSEFAALAPGDPKAEAFVAVEDWLNDGVPLAHKVVQDCFFGWYGRNDPAQGRWRVDGLPVLPSDWKKPVLSVIPEADRIVPPLSAKALADLLPRNTTLWTSVGHIGMMSARTAPDLVWDPILEFLADGISQ